MKTRCVVGRIWGGRFASALAIALVVLSSGCSGRVDETTARARSALFRPAQCSAEVDAAIRRAALRYQLPRWFYYALVHRESTFNPSLVTGAGFGLTQLTNKDHTGQPYPEDLSAPDNAYSTWKYNMGLTTFGPWIDMNDVSVLTDPLDSDQNLDRFSSGYAAPAFYLFKSRYGLSDAETLRAVAYHWNKGLPYTAAQNYDPNDQSYLPTYDQYVANYRPSVEADDGAWPGSPARPPYATGAGVRAIFTNSYQNGFAVSSEWFTTYEVTSGSIHLKSINDDWQGLELTTSAPFPASSYGQLQVRAHGSGRFALEANGQSWWFTLSGTDATYSMPVGALWSSGNVSGVSVKNVDANAEAFIDWMQFSNACGAELAAPLTVRPGQIDTFDVNGTTHWFSVPASYDAACHSTPKKLFVWLHGCGGQARYDIDQVRANSSAPSEDWIALAVGGAEGACWPSEATSTGIILGAIDALTTRLAIKSKEIILGGYSSGGDVGYPIIFKNSRRFALALFENTAPSNSSALIAAAAPPNGWRFPIRHLCHMSDQVASYKCDAVRPILGANGSAAQAGHASVLHEMAGLHWQDPTPDGRGTWPDFQAKLRPYLLQTFASP
jgi:hypothetical protein